MKKPKPAKPGKKPEKKGRPAPREGWVSKVALAAALGVTRSTIYAYLAKAEAPKPDANLRYDLAEVRAFVEAAGSKMIEGSVIQKMREEKMRLELEALRREAAVDSGELISAKQIEPTLKSMFAALTAQLRQEFEQVLPSKYKGKTLGECQQLNADAVDRVLLELARGCWSLGAGVPAPGPAPEPPPADPAKPGAEGAA